MYKSVGNMRQQPAELSVIENSCLLKCSIVSEKSTNIADCEQRSHTPGHSHQVRVVT